MRTGRYSLILRRLLAFAVDYLVIVFWAGILFLASTYLSQIIEDPDYYFLVYLHFFS